MSDASELVETMMHYIGKATGPLRLIDREIKDLMEMDLSENLDKLM